ncbi:MAG: hypothetical protein R3C05_20235 [Pirellulaceae bacterium]
MRYFVPYCLNAWKFSKKQRSPFQNYSNYRALGLSMPKRLEPIDIAFTSEKKVKKWLILEATSLGDRQQPKIIVRTSLPDEAARYFLLHAKMPKGTFCHVVVSMGFRLQLENGKVICDTVGIASYTSRPILNRCLEAQRHLDKIGQHSSYAFSDIATLNHAC